LGPKGRGSVPVKSSPSGDRKFIMDDVIVHEAFWLESGGQKMDPATKSDPN
jgi:hypothetical protein